MRRWLLKRGNPGVSPRFNRLKKELNAFFNRYKVICCDEQFKLALFGERAKAVHTRDGETETCSMCGDLCALKIVDQLLPAPDPTPVEKEE